MVVMVMVMMMVVGRGGDDDGGVGGGGDADGDCGEEISQFYIYKLPIDRLSGCYWYY